MELKVKTIKSMEWRQIKSYKLGHNIVGGDEYIITTFKIVLKLFVSFNLIQRKFGIELKTAVLVWVEACVSPE